MTTRRRWLVRLGVVAVLLALLVLFRRPILHGLGDLLIVDEPPVAGAVVLILGGDRSPELAIKAVQAGDTPTVLIVNWWPQRAEKLGITPSHATVLREVLVKQGVQDRNLQLLPGRPRDLYQVGDSIGVWLGQHPDQQLVVYCHRFNSRQVRVILQRVLGEQCERVHVQAVAHPEYNERDWWCNKAGLKDFWTAAIGLAFAWTHDRPGHDYPDWDPDAYEKGLQ